MDLLKAELERKRRSLAEASSRRGGDGNNGRRKRYLTAAERRRVEEEEEEEEERRAEEERAKRRRRKRKKRSRGDRDDDGSEEDGGEDLTTMLTRRYDPSERRKRAEEAAAATTASGGGGKVSGGAGGGAVAEDAATEGKEADPSDATGEDGRDDPVADSLRRLSPQEVTDALRRFGLPVRLFGERTAPPEGDGGRADDSARLHRLIAAVRGREAAMTGEAERDEFLLDSAHRARNVFLEKDAHHEEEGGEDDGGRRSPAAAASGDGREGGGAAPALTEEERNDKPKRIYRYFKSLLRQWEDDLSRRPDHAKRTAAGKNETKTLKQCKDYIRPLFRLCRRRELEEDLQSHLFRIVTACEEGEFVRAHDAYMDVAIGRAAWPIGVTMVGIHARSGRAKIESSNVAHVMNSELQRKYLTSVKRLMSYAQRKRPDVHPSKKVMNL